MAPPDAAVPFSRGSPALAAFEEFKVRSSPISGTALARPEIDAWPASSLAAGAGTEPEAKRNSAMSLPVIDLGGLRSGDPAARQQIVRELGAATEEWGFFQVVNHSVTDELQGRMDEQSRLFFNLPGDTKKRAGIVGANPRSFGYKEHLKLGRGWSSEEPIVIKESLADSRAASHSVADLTSKVWPGGNLTFSDTLEEYCLSVESLGRQVLELLAESLGVQSDFYSRHFKNPAERTGTWRLHHFLPNPLPVNIWRTVPHSDPSVLTLLRQDVGGLQVKKPGGVRWIDVDPMPGSFVVNVGDILEAWSNGRFPSVEHGVALDKVTERFATVNFLDAGPSLYIEAPPELIDHEHPSVFEPFVAQDFRRNFERTKKAGDISKGKALDYVRRRHI